MIGVPSPVGGTFRSGFGDGEGAAVGAGVASAVTAGAGVAVGSVFGAAVGAGVGVAGGGSFHTIANGEKPLTVSKSRSSPFESFSPSKTSMSPALWPSISSAYMW